MDNREEMPLGFSFTLSMNERAMERFAAMDEGAKASVIEEARHVASKQEMEQLVNRLGGTGQGFIG